MSSVNMGGVSWDAFQNIMSNDSIQDDQQIFFQNKEKTEITAEAGKARVYKKNPEINREQDSIYMRHQLVNAVRTSLAQNPASATPSGQARINALVNKLESYLLGSQTGGEIKDGLLVGSGFKANKATQPLLKREIKDVFAKMVQAQAHMGSDASRVTITKEMIDEPELFNAVYDQQKEKGSKDMMMADRLRIILDNAIDDKDNAAKVKANAAKYDLKSVDAYPIDTSMKATNPCVTDPFEEMVGSQAANAKTLHDMHKNDPNFQICTQIFGDCHYLGCYFQTGTSTQEENIFNCADPGAFENIVRTGTVQKEGGEKNRFEYKEGGYSTTTGYATQGQFVTDGQNRFDKPVDTDFLITSMPSLTASAVSFDKKGNFEYLLKCCALNGKKEFTEAERENAKAVIDLLCQPRLDKKSDGLKSREFKDAMMLLVFGGDATPCDVFHDSPEEAVRKLREFVKDAGKSKAALETANANYEKTLRSVISSWIQAAVQRGCTHFLGGGIGCGAFENPSEIVAKIIAEEFVKHGGKMKFVFCNYGGKDEKAGIFREAFKNAMRKFGGRAAQLKALKDSPKAPISVGQMGRLKEIAKMAYGRSEGSKGGAGFMASINGEIVKFLTHSDERSEKLADFTEENKASVNAATAELKAELVKIARTINPVLADVVEEKLKMRKMGKSGLKGLSREDVATAITEIMKYAKDASGNEFGWKDPVFKTVQKIDHTRIQDIFISVGLKTDYKLDELGAKTPITTDIAINEGTKLNHRVFAANVKKACKGNTFQHAFAYAINQFSLQAFKLNMGTDALKNRYLELIKGLKKDIESASSKDSAMNLEKVLSKRINRVMDKKNDDEIELLEEMKEIFSEVSGLFPSQGTGLEEL